jgi:PadR family transcriptional regulator PadR
MAANRAVTEPAFFILTALVDAPRHGYGIVGEVAELSGGRVNLKIGTLYGVLDRLVGDGLVELDREEVQQGRLRRYYKLTDAGRHALHAEADRQAANARVAAERLRAWKAAAERATTQRPVRPATSSRPARPATQGGTA